MNRKVITLISSSLLLSCNTSLVFLFGLGYFTPLLRRSQLALLAFAGAILVISIGTRILFKTNFLRFSDRALCLSISALALSLCLTWGLFSSWVMYSQLISWTTFLVLLLNCAMSISVLSAVHPVLSLLRVTPLAQMAPLMITSFVWLSGEQSMAFGFFFIGFSFSTFRLGVIQNRAYWENIRNSNKIEAVVDALPGSLVWMGRDMKIQGSNWQFRDRFSVSSELGYPDSIKGLATKVLAGQIPTEEVKVGRKTSLMTGKAFNNGQDAVIMGIDVSAREVFESQLGEAREKLLKNIDQFEKGKLFHALFGSSTGSYSQQELSEFQSITKEKTAPIGMIVCWAMRLARQVGPLVVDTKIEYLDSENDVLVPEPMKLLFALFEILSNSFEAVKSVKSPSVKVAVEVQDDKMEISIFDNGTGIEEAYEDLIFEPFITAKDNHLGMGLSLARENLASIGEVSLRRSGSSGCQVNVSIHREHLIEDVA